MREEQEHGAISPLLFKLFARRVNSPEPIDTR